MADRQAKDALFDAFGEVAKALGNGRRAELVDVLAQGERHVDDLAAEIGQSLANTSFHLRVLAAAGVVTTRREGTQDLLPTDLGHASANCGRPCATLPPPITSNSTNSLPPTWATVAGSSRSVRPNSPNESAPAMSSSSMFDPPPSSRPDTSPEPDRSRSTNSPTTSGTFPPGSRSSPTAGARTACSPTTLFDFCADADALRDASRTATPNGSAPTCPPRRQPRRERARHPARPRLPRRVRLQRAATGREPHFVNFAERTPARESRGAHTPFSRPRPYSLALTNRRRVGGTDRRRSDPLGRQRAPRPTHVLTPDHDLTRANWLTPR